MTIIYAAFYNGVSIQVSQDIYEKIKEDANSLILNGLRAGYSLSEIADFHKCRLERMSKALTKRFNYDDDLVNAWGKCWQYYKIEYLLNIQTLIRLKLDEGGDIRWVTITLSGFD